MNRSHTPSPRSSRHQSEDYSNLSDSGEFSRSASQSPVFMRDEIDAESTASIFNLNVERSLQAEHLLIKLQELTRTTLESAQDSKEKEIEKKIQIRDARLANIKNYRQTANF